MQVQLWLLHLDLRPPREDGKEEWRVPEEKLEERTKMRNGGISKKEAKEWSRGCPVTRKMNPGSVLWRKR